jgi:heme/copper-type cytochrome/quinol oxidase subunit 3
MAAWFYVTLKTFKQDASILQPESIGLLGTYWHYMLLVWVMLFGLLLTT